MALTLDLPVVAPASLESLVDVSLYAPWQPGELLLRSERKRLAAQMLYQAGAFPSARRQCLEVGYGTIGWLGELISWGVPETNLHGIEADASRAHCARAILPCADLRIGDACDLPWNDNSFQLVIASTVFTSIRDDRAQSQIAGEITRVLSPGGALLWYDFAVPSPRNPNVRRITRRKLRQLFPQLAGHIRSVSLAPPLARLVAPRSWTLAALLEAIPLLRTHLLAVLVKPHRT
jgi:ubiquinone/menaquinone biosynthesis C-methylase UbiE